MKDVFGRDYARLRGKTLYLLDMDGTLYLGDRVFDGTRGFLSGIKARGRYVFITNNSSRSPADYVARLASMGIEASKEDFFTSVDAAALLLADRHPGGLIYAQGTRSMIGQLREAGIRVVTEPCSEAEAVLVGFDTELTFEKLVNTVKMLALGTPFYATNPDLVCPVEFGSVPDCGSMCVGLENATGRKPYYIGKPRPDMIRIAMEKYGALPEETLVVGDRLYTDIAAGVNAGVDTVCVLSGEATLEDIEHADLRPDYVLDSVRDLICLFEH
ncbi:MAG: HAD-IIA family hydrolase [Abditibacteriota bacterium]|nr:HAD-IIA family hydrolase [Abditibacteriota bacterium]